MSRRKPTEPESPIRRRFSVRTEAGKKPERGTADVDTGANASNITRAVACRLVPDLEKPNTLALLASGEYVGGNLIEVELRVGNKAARVRAFVPGIVYLLDGTTKNIEGQNLIGLDFLRRTKAVLDFGRRRGRELRGARGIVAFRPMTAREAAAVPNIRCPGKRR